MLAFMYGIGLQEALIVLGLALLLFGARRLPDLGRSLGRGILEFRRAIAGEGRGHDGMR